MVFKKLFGGGNKEKLEQELDTDDLIALERYEEAAERLRQRVKAVPTDLHSHLKLAGVYQAQRQDAKAVDQFVLVADEYADDGFYDKALALLAKAIKMAPGDPSLAERVEALERSKRLEHSRSFAIEGLLRKSDGGAQHGTSVIEAQMLWAHLQETTLVQRFAPEQLKRLLSGMELVKVAARELLAERGSIDERMFLIVYGAVEALAESATGLTEVRRFGGGDLFGESALFERKPWGAHYRASENSLVMTLDRTGLEKTMLGNPDPKALIDELRAQQHDRLVREAIEKLERRP